MHLLDAQNKAKRRPGSLIAVGYCDGRGDLVEWLNSGEK